MEGTWHGASATDELRRQLRQQRSAPTAAHMARAGAPAAAVLGDETWHGATSAAALAAWSGADPQDAQRFINQARRQRQEQRKLARLMLEGSTHGGGQLPVLRGPAGAAAAAAGGGGGSGGTTVNDAAAAAEQASPMQGVERVGLGGVVRALMPLKEQDGEPGGWGRLTAGLCCWLLVCAYARLGNPLPPPPTSSTKPPLAQGCVWSTPTTTSSPDPRPQPPHRRDGRRRAPPWRQSPRPPGHGAHHPGPDRRGAAAARG